MSGTRSPIAIAISIIGLSLANEVVVAQPCTGSTVAYWRFDGDYADSCGSIDGTPAGSASIATSNCAPLSGNSGCLVLNGAPSRVELPAPFNTSPLPVGTIEAWVYVEATGQGSFESRFFNHGVPAQQTNLGVDVLARAGGGYESVFRSMNVNFPPVFLPGFTENTWHHLAWTWDATTVTCFLDGVIVGTGPGTIPVSFTGNSAQLGGDDQDHLYWVGRLDEIRLSNRILTPNEFIGFTSPVPTVSDWGLIAMALLVLTAGTLVYARRRTTLA